MIENCLVNHFWFFCLIELSNFLLLNLLLRIHLLAYDRLYLILCV